MQPTRKRAEDHPRPPIQARATSHCIGEDAMPIGEQLRELNKELFAARALTEELRASVARRCLSNCVALSMMRVMIPCRVLR